MHTRFTPFLALSALLFLAGCMSLFTGGPLIMDPNLPTGEIVINNQSGRSIVGVSISNCRASTYGPNRMERGESIPHGRQRSFTVSVGCWDVYVRGYDGSSQRQRMEVGTNGMRYTLGEPENN